MAGVSAIFLGLGLPAAIRLPAVAALTRSTKAFESLPYDSRVRFEPGAEDMADRVAAFLDQAIATVEREQGSPFIKPFQVFVCASQRSLNEFIALPPGVPIRGTVRFGQVFLAPSAFDWLGEDVHQGSLLHEMSHLHIRQHLGFLASRERVPSWFHEGLADLVGQVGGEGVTEAEAIAAILEGRTLSPDSTGRLWTLERVSSNGLIGPMFHRQSRMFLTYIRNRDPESFRSFLRELVETRAFSGPFRTSLGAGTEEMWKAFAASFDDPDPTPVSSSKRPD